MNLNWMVIVIVFLVTLVISIFIGVHLPKNSVFIIPIIGGVIAGYWVDGNYTDGIVNGGIPVGLAGFVFTSEIVGLAFYFVFGIIGFAIKERKLIKEILID